MPTFQASATAPNCKYDESAEMPDAAFEAILASARKRFGQVGEGDARRDMTNEEVCQKMLGSFLLGWAGNAKVDAREDAIAKIGEVAAPDWTVTKAIEPVADKVAPADPAPAPAEPAPVANAEPVADPAPAAPAPAIAQPAPEGV
jgi:hypothetical protein